MIFFLISFSLSLLFSIFLVTNLIFYTLSLLILTLSLLLLIVASSYVYGLTSIIVAVVYVGAIIILIGYICAICPNIYTSVLSLKRIPYVLSSPLFLLTFLRKEFSQTPSSNIDLSLSCFFYRLDGLPLLVFLSLFLFLCLLMITTSLSAPRGPFRSSR